MVIGRLFFFLLATPIFRGYVSFGEGILFLILVNDTHFFCWGGVLKNMELKPMRDQRLRKASCCCNKKCCLFSCNFPNERSLPSIVVAGGKPTRRCDSTWSGWSPAHSDNWSSGKLEMRSTDKIFLRFSDLGCGF